ncbi:conserved Plasmodium protein, unknown function [Plasmodium knowlesi strain H]|uniref:Uncharacterized protein n=3 Tax=Plasmodium knowlesi TaxID=5850 RepID=A0A5K1UK73_PLAKH|nr:conserved Plasmodium protein, unknown function [Plasmodium knowlesi strain H]OTN67533.1 Uncharacterized protein PKNOH_S06428700 [Plasmodium knowlesi]CAA9987558.1 conserved Plasmodium protein, unknown function [Plasmodium knowlesi strain H]SBO23062.1 conserved Plasmodium protein, unknown function [Plasmodium knowlesi strain H]SBO23719.1 conserved Plasmodium protein, unknown function [Plasmodium knowlesi strain H]VVS77032.1 conserved Plasmodium protein, unknown function [Plasmodium knowlesi s|eukprot:XP_002258559.1 hypothetical protein, conserved in Plasmodium species [Plasmodium knowlesi strain H]
MEEKGQSKNKRVMESPYDIELESLDEEKSTSVLKSLLGVINTDESLKSFTFNHDKIVDCLECDALQAVIVIRTTQYEQFYKHIPLIATLHKIDFVLIEHRYVNTPDFIKLPKTGLIGILPLQTEDQSLPGLSEKVQNLVSVVHTYHLDVTLPYLFGHPNYINTKFKVEEVKAKPYAKHLSRKERKALRKSIRKSNI